MTPMLLGSSSYEHRYKTPVHVKQNAKMLSTTVTITISKKIRDKTIRAEFSALGLLSYCNIYVAQVIFGLIPIKCTTTRLLCASNKEHWYANICIYSGA